MKLKEILVENEFIDAIKRLEREKNEVEKKIEKLKTKQQSLFKQSNHNRYDRNGSDYLATELDLEIKDNKDKISKAYTHIGKIVKKINEYKSLMKSPLHKES